MNSVYTWTERFKAVTKHISDLSLWVICSSHDLT